MHAHEVAALAERATAGPWHRVGNFANGLHLQSVNGRIVGEMQSECLPFAQDVDNAEFVAAARTHWPAHAQQLCDLQRELEEARAELKLWKPLTPEEAEAALDEAEAIPISDEELNRIVALVTDPAYRPSEPEHVKLAAKVRQQARQLDEARERLIACHKQACTPENCKLDGGPEHQEAFGPAICIGCNGRGGWEDGDEGQWVVCECQACAWCGQTKESHGHPGSHAFADYQKLREARLCPVPGVSSQFYTPKGPRK
jgi:hypothetical protein